MKKHFELTLEGREWSVPVLVFWVIYLLLLGGQQALTRYGSPAGPGLGLLLNLVIMIALVLLEATFTIVLFRIVAPRLSIGGHPFAFSGSVGKYVGLNLKGALLSIITLGIYAPWFLRNILAYLTSHTTYRGAALQFMGKPKKLLKYFLLSLYLPLIVIIAGLSVVLVLVTLRGGNVSARGATQTVTMLTTVVILLVLVPFICLTLRWYVDVQWTDSRAQWRTSFWPFCGFVLGQLLLTLITLGVYGPAGYLRVYRYFTERTVITRGDAQSARLGFDGSIRSGFGLLWGQGLLCVITLGFASPWAYARVARWLFGATFLEQQGT